MRSIEVSEAVYRRIESLARPFVDKDPNDVLERVLQSLASDADMSENATSAGIDLVNHTGRVPHGTDLRAKYKGREYHARVENGRVVFDGRLFDSLSSAAVGVIRSTGTNRPTENGWRFWEAKDRRGNWVAANELFMNGNS
jgi:hypothetical protein